MTGRVHARLDRGAASWRLTRRAACGARAPDRSHQRGATPAIKATTTTATAPLTRAASVSTGRRKVAATAEHKLVPEASGANAGWSASNLGRPAATVHASASERYAVPNAST